MKKSFLNNLAGMEVAKAEELVLAEGHQIFLVPEKCNAIPLIARGNTVVLWQKDGKIHHANAGDPCQVEDDIGPQRAVPSSVEKIQAEVKQVKRTLGELK